MADQWRTGLVVLVGAGWIFNLVAPVFVTSYESNLAANAPLMLILGAVFAVRKKPGGGDN